MRQILLFPALFFAFLVPVHAEQGDNSNTTASPTVGGVFPHFSQTAGVRGQLQNYRMIAKAYARFYDAAFVGIDSTTYQYGAYRGSIPNLEDINNDDHVLFDMSVKYRFNSSTWGYENSTLRTQTFFANNKVNELIYKNWNNSAWKNSERYSYTYDNSGKMETSKLEQWYGTLWTNGIESKLDYDNNKNVVKMNGITYKIDFTYDINNNLVEIIDSVWSFSSGWTYNNRKNYTYSGSNVVSYVLEQWDNGQWVKSQRWEYSYDANDNTIQTTEYTWNNGSWQPAYQHNCTFDANNNKEEEITKVWSHNANAYIFSKREKITYNAESLPISIKTYSWVNQSWGHASGDICINYYYEKYDPNSVLNNITNAATLSVYPVPAHDNINIKLSWDNPVDFTVSIIDMTGKMIYQTAEPKAVTYNKSIPVSNLPAGHYAVLVSNSNQTLTKRIVVN